MKFRTCSVFGRRVPLGARRLILDPTEAWLARPSADFRRRLAPHSLKDRPMAADRSFDSTLRQLVHRTSNPGRNDTTDRAATEGHGLE